jgi:rsbT co-antagonist protein RsbR
MSEMSQNPSRADGPRTTDDPTVAAEQEQLLPQLVAHLREHRSKVREEWVGP